MTDEEYVLKYDAAEKKKTARAIRNTNRTGKGPVHFPSDYMTKKERDAMNGDVATYNLRRPMKWKEFKSMPEDLQREYLRYIDEAFCPSNSTLGEMLGVSNATVITARKALSVNNPHGGRKNHGWNPAVWCEWIKPRKSPQEPPEEVQEAPHENMLTPLPEDTFSVSSGEITLIASPAELAQVLTVLGGAERRNFCVKFWKNETAPVARSRPCEVA